MCRSDVSPSCGDGERSTRNRSSDQDILTLTPADINARSPHNLLHRHSHRNAPHPDHGSPVNTRNLDNAHISPISVLASEVSGLKSEELGIDFMPSMRLGSMSMQPSLDMLGRTGPLDMQTDDWMHSGNTLPLHRDSLTIAQLSRYPSGLDTMQSIEQALPDDLHSHAVRAQQYGMHDNGRRDDSIHYALTAHAERSHVSH